MLESCHVCVAPSYSLCCSVMQCDAVSCSVLQCVADRCVYVCVHDIWKMTCVLTAKTNSRECEYTH